MRVALIAPPLITIPPRDYGGTELFVAHLATALRELGVEITVYTNGESTVEVPRRWLYDRSYWPIKQPEHAWMQDLNHTSWSLHDASKHCDIVHIQSAHALTFSRFVDVPMVLTLHGPHESKLSELYTFFPDIHYVCISRDQCKRESMPLTRTIHHGIDMSGYRLVERKQNYLSFIGRISPIKGTHIAVDVAKQTGIPLKIAGDVQPLNREYFERKIKPHIDGKLIEYIGPANLEIKNELLGNSKAMLFPIQWNEPFGLVMVEAMACGTPVLAMPGGSVPEIVVPGTSGYICRTTKEMAKWALTAELNAVTIRKYVEENFSTTRMAKAYLDLYQDVVAGFNSRKVAS